MIETQSPTIIFLKVADNQSKMALICDTVHKHFLAGEVVLLTVPNGDAANYLDQLLWKFPAESFLPHSVSEKASNDPVVITTGKSNPNNAVVLFNLLPDVNPGYNTFKVVYELFDETHPEKLRLSQQRQQIYASNGKQIQI